VIGRAPAGASPESFRLFVALTLPPDVAKAVERHLAPVRALFPGARWISREFLHLTLVFLGATDTGRIGRLRSALDAAAHDQARFSVELGSGGGRARPDGDGVAWLNLVRGGDETAALGRRLEAAISGSAPDGARDPRRSPNAHLTVARRAPAELIEQLGSSPPASPRVTWLADRIVLFRSHLERTGARYEALHEAALRP
jgi:RNA 2',3'-cyclic 3'-phosphodiesterase